MNTATATAGLKSGASGSASPGAASQADRCETLPLLPVCSHSISTRLSRKLAVVTMVVIGLLSWTSWMSVSMLIQERNREDMALRCSLLDDVLTLEATRGGEAAVLERLRSDAPMRGGTLLEVWRANGQVLYADRAAATLAGSDHVRSHDFVIHAQTLPGGMLRARYTADFTKDAEMGQRWGWLLAFVTVLAGAIVAAGSFWHVRRELRPLKTLALRTHAISPQNLHERLSLPDPAQELKPWVDQFNALMERLERAYAQLEGFNADVAHELRTPLAALIGETEVALSRERSPEVLRDTLASNLEEMQRLSAMVNDMLFLASADRGVRARRGEAVRLSELAQQVSEFHEAPLEDAGLTLRVEGDAELPVDEPLVKRALSNLLGNAARYAERGSTVVVRISRPGDGGGAADADAVQVVVENRGKPIPTEELPRLFDRFFRGDSSRTCPTQQHHGLGLAIVAAIARMHGGSTLAASRDGLTQVGFTLTRG